MEYWEITRARANATLPVWQTYLASTKINAQTPAQYEALIDQFEPKAQDEYDTAVRAVDGDAEGGLESGGEKEGVTLRRRLSRDGKSLPPWALPPHRGARQSRGHAFPPFPPALGGTSARGAGPR